MQPMNRTCATATFAALVLLQAAGGADGDRPGPIALEQCRIKPIDQVVLASDRAGLLAFVEPREGDEVRTGQQVAGLKDEVARAAAAVAAKRAENDVRIRFARKAAEVARAEHEKALEANQQARGAIPEIEVQRLKLAEQKSLLEIEQAEYEYNISELEHKQAAAELKTFEVVAPFDGFVTRIYKQKGEAVRQGDPIMEISNTARVRVEGYLDIRDITSVRRGAPVDVQLDVAETTEPIEREVFHGKLVFVDVGVEPVTGRRVRVWAEVVNRDGLLRSGLRARMSIHPQQPAAGSRP